jgi:hypothetical protein
VFYERQPDGSVVLAVDQPGFGGQPVGSSKPPDARGR